jgi:exonuclease III
MALRWNYNCDGLPAVGLVPRLLRLLEEHRLDYVCLSETRAKPTSLTSVSGYVLFAPSLRNSGGVALLIKATLDPKHLANIDMPGGQAVLASVTGGIVGSIYAPPRASTHELQSFILRLRCYQAAKLLVGDWNARAVQ